MKENRKKGTIESQYSPLGEVGKKIIREWRNYKREVGGLEGEIILDQVARGITMEESEKEIESLRSIRKTLIDEFNAKRVK
jgi:hypothetical protein